VGAALLFASQNAENQGRSMPARSYFQVKQRLRDDVAIGRRDAGHQLIMIFAANEIEWLQAQGNYVNLQVRGRAYPLRSTMTAVQALLDPVKFVRVHRSHIVNLDYLIEIEPLDTGDARLELRDGTLVACSRTYRDALRGRTV
jgi:DNA-binding LytR/AlgR family response regulator